MSEASSSSLSTSVKGIKPINVPALKAHIYSYYETDTDKLCAIASNHGQTCSPVGRVYRDKNRKALSCAYYCLKNATLEQLLPIFVDLPTKVGLTFYNNKSVEFTDLTFKVSIYESDGIHDSDYSFLRHSSMDPDKWVVTYNEDADLVYKRVITPEVAAQTLYDFLQIKSPMSFEVSIFLPIHMRDTAENVFYRVAAITMDKPYIKPEYLWQPGVTEWNELNDNIASISVKFNLQGL